MVNGAIPFADIMTGGCKEKDIVQERVDPSCVLHLVHTSGRNAGPQSRNASSSDWLCI